MPLWCGHVQTSTRFYCPDTSRCTHVSLSNSIDGKVVLEVKEADPEVVRKCACGQWSMGSGAEDFLSAVGLTTRLHLYEDENETAFK